MSSKIIKCWYGVAEVGDDYGLHIRVDDGDNAARIGLTVEDARAIARALEAFAEIHDTAKAANP